MDFRWSGAAKAVLLLAPYGRDARPVRSAKDSVGPAQKGAGTVATSGLSARARGTEPSCIGVHSALRWGKRSSTLLSVDPNSLNRIYYGKSVAGG